MKTYKYEDKVIIPLVSEYTLRPWYYIDKHGQIYKVTDKGEEVKIVKMQPFVNKDGYTEYVLTLDNGSKKHIQSHRSCALTWKKPKGGVKHLDVNHINGKRDDNHHSNLEWVSRSDNLKHSYRELGRVIHNKGKKKQPNGSYK